MLAIKLTAFLSFLIIACYPQSSKLYSKSYGDKNNEAIIFLHGGPGYNSVSFELSTANDLAKKGFYVIVYDQRGSGRSVNYIGNGGYSFAEQCKDLLGIYDKYEITKAALIGHSWGGTLATKFAEQHPEKVKSLVFADSPISYQLMFKGILEKCKIKFSLAKDSANLKRLAMIAKLDTASLSYSSMCFLYAMNNGFYSPASASIEADSLLKNLRSQKEATYMSKMENAPVQGANLAEKYTTLNLRKDWADLKKLIPLYGIYGDEDGLFDQTQFSLIKTTLGEDHFFLVKGASHNVFIDQHTEFINLLSTVLGHK